MTSQIEFRDVHRSFGDQEVLRGLSFSVKPGHIHAFLGRNGAGKTTALRILLGFLEPHHASARPSDVSGRRAPTSLEHRSSLGDRSGPADPIRVIDRAAREALIPFAGGTHHQTHGSIGPPDQAWSSHSVGRDPEGLWEVRTHLEP